jgi:hypothetical protein
VVGDEVRLADGIRLGLEAEGCAVDDTALLLTTAAPDTAQNDPDGMVSEIGDKRIEEASGLALSMKHDDLVYTMNDEGGPSSKVYADQLSTGEVVGATDISGLPIEDPNRSPSTPTARSGLATLGTTITNATTSRSSPSRSRAQVNTGRLE